MVRKKYSEAEKREFISKAVDNSAGTENVALEIGIAPSTAFKFAKDYRKGKLFP